DTISRTNPLAAKDPAMSLQRTERHGRGTRFLGRAGGVVRVFHGAVFCPILPRVVYVVPKRQEQAKYDRRGKGFLLFNSLPTVRISASWGKITAGRKVLVLRPPLRLRRCFGKYDSFIGSIDDFGAGSLKHADRCGWLRIRGFGCGSLFRRSWSRRHPRRQRRPETGGAEKRPGAYPRKVLA